MHLDLIDDESHWTGVYRLLISFVLPRPIGWVSTVSAAGVRNLAPFSLYNLVSANPPVVMFSPAVRSDGGKKDTLRNVEETGEFVVATATEGLAEQMNTSAADVGADVNEFELAGLTPRAATRVKASLVGESPVNIECRLLEIKHFGDQPGAGNVVFGAILAIHVDDAVLADDGLVDPGKLQALGRMGRLTYAKTGDCFDLPRPKA